MRFAIAAIALMVAAVPAGAEQSRHACWRRASSGRSWSPVARHSV